MRGSADPRGTVPSPRRASNATSRNLLKWKKGVDPNPIAPERWERSCCAKGRSANRLRGEYDSRLPLTLRRTVPKRESGGREPFEARVSVTRHRTSKKFQDGLNGAQMMCFSLQVES